MHIRIDALETCLNRQRFRRSVQAMGYSRITLAVLIILTGWSWPLSQSRGICRDIIPK